MRNVEGSLRVLIYIQGAVIASFVELQVRPEHALKHHAGVSDAPKQL